MLRVELKSDEGDLRRDAGHLHLHRLILRHAHVLEHSWQENHPICYREGKVRFMSNKSHCCIVTNYVINTNIHPEHLQTDAYIHADKQLNQL